MAGGRVRTGGSVGLAHLPGVLQAGFLGRFVKDVVVTLLRVLVSGCTALFALLLGSKEGNILTKKERSESVRLASGFTPIFLAKGTAGFNAIHVWSMEDEKGCGIVRWIVKGVGA